VEVDKPNREGLTALQVAAQSPAVIAGWCSAAQWTSPPTTSPLMS
jgi:hypothetical protein